jgi:hypothetical protein
MRLCSFLVLALLPAIAQAAPESFVHNGRVLDAFGGPLQGEHTLGFSAHAGPGTSDNLWDESETVVLADGYYSVVLGDETPFPGTLWDGAVRWLQVAVGARKQQCEPTLPDWRTLLSTRPETSPRTA